MSPPPRATSRPIAPDARAVIWPDVAHMIGLEQPERLAAAISSSWRRCRAGRDGRTRRDRGAARPRAGSARASSSRWWSGSRCSGRAAGPRRRRPRVAHRERERRARTARLPVDRGARPAAGERARRPPPSPATRSTASSRTGRWTTRSPTTSRRRTSRPSPCSRSPTARRRDRHGPARLSAHHRSDLGRRLVREAHDRKAARRS